jgi:nicotinate-nucleotide pyrophosphorylase (carboxylating)
MFSVLRLIEIALSEDIGPGDVTTDSLVDPEREGKGVITAKENLVIAGLDVARQVFSVLEPTVRFSPFFRDGDAVGVGRPVLTVEGKLHTLLKGERTSLNFLQRLSGIATQTRAFVESLGGETARLVDTRKTTPGWRELEKYAVRVGGGRNHRMGLYDGVLIKDNHILVSGGIRNAVEAVRKKVHHLLRVEVEVSDIAGVHEALSAGADVIMLDNMNLEQIREAVAAIGKRALVEVSGGLTRKDLAGLSRIGVDLISSGALTHSARAVDLSMRIT